MATSSRGELTANGGKLVKEDANIITVKWALLLLLVLLVASMLVKFFITSPALGPTVEGFSLDKTLDDFTKEQRSLGLVVSDGVLTLPSGNKIEMCFGIDKIATKVLGFRGSSLKVSNNSITTCGTHFAGGDSKDSVRRKLGNPEEETEEYWYYSIYGRNILLTWADGSLLVVELDREKPNLSPEPTSSGSAHETEKIVR